MTQGTQEYSFDTIYLDTDPGGPGYRTGSWELAKARAIREAQRTHKRQVIQVFPSSEQPSRNIHRVFELDIDSLYLTVADVLNELTVDSSMLETRARFIDPIHNGL